MAFVSKLRWYDVEVLYAVPGIRERRFTGAPANNMPLKELLEALSSHLSQYHSLVGICGVYTEFGKYFSSPTVALIAAWEKSG